MVKTFSTEVLRDIYCSPGIYHRVSLSRYINNIDITSIDLALVYSLNKGIDPYIRSEAEGLRKKIADINQAYYVAEEKCIRYSFNQNTFLKFDYINNQCKNIDGYKEYREYYNNIYHMIPNEYQSSYKKFDRTTAKHVAKYILTSGKFKSPAYRLIHFWVIISSYLPKDFFGTTLKNE